MATRAKVVVVCPTCDYKMRVMKLGDKDEGGEAKCKCCQETALLPKILVLEPVKEIPPAEDESD